MNNMLNTAFVPQLIIPRGTVDISFYQNAFGAVEVKRFTNEDGSIHVSEMCIDEAMFQLHEENEEGSCFSPTKHHGITTRIGLMVGDVDAVVARAMEAGARVVTPVKSYAYGYRQGTIMDPWGHEWLIETRI